MSIVFITGLKYLDLLHPRGIFSHTRRLGLFFWFKILNINIFLGFSEKLFFVGYEDFVDIILGHHKSGHV